MISYRQIAIDAATLDVEVFHELERAHWKDFERIIKDMIRFRLYRTWRNHYDTCANPSQCSTCDRLVNALADRIPWAIARRSRLYRTVAARASEIHRSFNDVKRQHLIAGIYLALGDASLPHADIRIGYTDYLSVVDPLDEPGWREIRFATKVTGIIVPTDDLRDGTSDFVDWLRIRAIHHAEALLVETFGASYNADEAGILGFAQSACGRRTKRTIESDLERDRRAVRPTRREIPRCKTPETLTGWIAEQPPGFTARQLADSWNALKTGRKTNPGSIRALRSRGATRGKHS